MADSDNPLRGPRLKIERAKRHLADFENAMNAFFDANPYEIVSDRDPVTREQVYRIKVRQPVPDEFSVIAGDIIHNLRSALDQLVCALVRANRKQVSGGNSFPISGSSKRFEEAAVGKLKNLPPKAVRLIRRLKPYNGGNSALWMLSELDNMDKHNAIVPVAAGQAQASVKWGLPGVFISPDGHICIGGGPPGSTPFARGMSFGIPDSGAPLIEILHDDCEIYRSKVSAMGIPERVQVAIEITFGKTSVTGSEPIITTLQGLIQLVERIVDIVDRRIL